MPYVDLQIMHLVIENVLLLSPHPLYALSLESYVLYLLNLYLLKYCWIQKALSRLPAIRAGECNYITKVVESSL